MISNERGYSEAFVWIWLPGAIEPVVAGKLTADADKLIFNYGKSYLNRKNAISIYDAELPLKSGVLPPLAGLIMAVLIWLGLSGFARVWMRFARIAPRVSRNTRS